MTKTLPLTILSVLVFSAVFAGRISGKVSDEKGNPLAYASVFVKGSTIGTTANNQGEYYLDLEPGAYTILCQYVGYAREEKKLTVSAGNTVLNFTLSPQQTTMKEVVVHAGGEDPAYEIIRQAIKKKKDYVSPLDSFTCEAYIKTLMKTRKLPNKLLGQKIEQKDKMEMGVDSAGKGIIFLSESLTRIAFKKPNKIKLEVVSGRESGSNGYGFNFPTFINFYNNNVNVLADQLNPRGFVSPIADGALNYYRYKYLGSFFEDGKEVNQIQVIPRRKYEPLFSGTINITEGDWRIHSLELLLTKESQLQLLDTMRIKQIHVPITKDIWQTKDQTVYFTFNFFGIDAVGNFLNVYNKYDPNPGFKKKYFNNVVMVYDTAVNKKSKQYWDSVRPVQLEAEEAKNYIIKDSIFRYSRDSVRTKAYVDSMRRHQGTITVKKICWSGFSRNNFHSNPMHFSWKPLLKGVQYNTVEGVNVNVEATIDKSFRKSRSQISFTPHIRYGFSNTHLNAWATLNYSKRSYTHNDDGGSTWGRSNWSFAGGKRVSQFNNANPIAPLLNSVSTLLYRRNYMKIYENYFGSITLNKSLDNGLRITGSLLYEDRLPLDNTADYSLYKKDSSRHFTPNYPYEKITEQFARHQAAIAGIVLTWQPGQRYIQFPNYKQPIGSKYPTFSLAYTKGIDNILGSDVDFDKWKFTIQHDVNLKLRGLLKYRLSAGGFLNTKKLYIQDYQHFNGNQLLLASNYLSSFQLAPYYANSTTAAFYAEGHVEHHFNGLLTNKIPLFKRLNWFLVGGSNAFFVNKNNNYVEAFGGIENILKIFRVDVVASYLNGKTGQVGVRLGFGGLIGGAVQVN